MSLFKDLPAASTAFAKEAMPNERICEQSDKNKTDEAHKKDTQQHKDGHQSEVAQQRLNQVPPSNEGVSRKRPSTDNSSDDSTKQTKLDNSSIAFLKSYVAERKGERDDMQDAHILLDDCTKDFPQLAPKTSRVAYFAVFDGHGGNRASLFSAKWLHVHLSQKIPSSNVNNFEKELKRQVFDSFKKLDEDFLKEASKNKPVWKDGTTACCVLVLDDVLYIANLGDSKAVLCRYNSELQKPVPVALSKDHNPTNYEERMRIQKAGGNVREGRVLGILEVSRSIGDGQYKRCGVINVPDIKRCQLNSNDRFILIACDGLWKVFSPDKAIEFVLQILKDTSVLPPEGSHKDSKEYRYEVACNRLASEAVRKGSADNVTVVLVSVQKS